MCLTASHYIVSLMAHLLGKRHVDCPVPTQNLAPLPLTCHCYVKPGSRVIHVIASSQTVTRLARLSVKHDICKAMVTHDWHACLKYNACISCLSVRVSALIQCNKGAKCQ